ncbi:hypothetical protein E5Q_04962 [Mixia osmundae IAM 14324]|uniref:Uncharacterized protein n=1 Tax=Mixia osmundae (strain CBS 9802 / IAM 14324 / JCM 22182 / KY 12970) TaxID=764103 RepID=G7E619_MIXOS|nr:hypothetical protein E5Q_04962 [Mixia osmundae IAM 14324]
MHMKNHAQGPEPCRTPQESTLTVQPNSTGCMRQLIRVS